MGVQTKCTTEQTVGQLTTFCASLRWMMQELETIKGNEYVSQAMKSLAAAEIHLGLAQKSIAAQDNKLAELQHPPSERSMTSALDDLQRVAQYLTTPRSPLSVYRRAVAELAKITEGETVSLQSVAATVSDALRRSELSDPRTLHSKLKRLQDMGLLTMTPPGRRTDFADYQVQLTDVGRQLYQKKWFNTLTLQPRVRTD